MVSFQHLLVVVDEKLIKEVISAVTPYEQVVDDTYRVRVDSAVYQGYAIPPYYDSLLGKLIVHGKTRTECLMRLRRALDEFVVDGVETTLPLFRALVRDQQIIDGQYHIHWLEQFLARDGMEAG